MYKQFFFSLLSLVSVVKSFAENYEIIKEGTGQTVQSYNSPLIRWRGEENSEPEIISLDETIPGLKNGMIGMKEGEIRIVYIPPESSNSFEPLAFEIELIKADVSAEAHAASHQEILPFSPHPDTSSLYFR